MCSVVHSSLSYWQEGMCTETCVHIFSKCAMVLVPRWLLNVHMLSLLCDVFSVFIQTDKAKYKPGDTVKFRTFATDMDLRPLTLPLTIKISVSESMRKSPPYVIVLFHKPMQIHHIINILNI